METFICNQPKELVQISIPKFKFSKKHDDIFRNANFTLNEGELVAVTGVNGSGKSTLLNLMLGFIYNEKIQLKNNCKFCYLGDSVGFHPSLNYYAHKDFFQNLHGSTFVAREFFLLSEEYKTKEYRHLSLGNKAKVRINLSIHSQYVIMDEPTEGLDADSKALFIEKMKLGKFTGLVVSHDAEFIHEICTHKVIIENHQISEKISLS